MSNRHTSITEVTALISGITILSSIVYEWFYYKIVGPDLIVFLSTSDFIDLAISWFPGFVLIGLVYWIYEFLMTGIERGKSEEELIAGSRTPKPTKWFRKSSEYFVGTVLFIGSLLQYLLVPGASYSSLGISLIIVWFFLSNRVLKIPRLTQRYTQQIRSTIILIPIFVIIFGSLGASEAQKDLKKESGEYSIVIRDKTEVNNFQVLRSIQVGILLTPA